MRKFFHSLIFLLAISACTKPDKKAGKPTPDEAALITTGFEHQTKADQLLAKGISDSAYYHFIRASAAYEKAHDSLRMSYVLLRMAGIQHSNNDYHQMQALDIEALKFLGKKPADDYMLTIYTDLGISYHFLENEEKAIENYKKALAVVKDSVHNLRILNNLADVEMARDSFKKARKFLVKASNSRYFNRDLQTKAMILDNLGFCNFRLGNPEAGSQMADALRIRDSTNDRMGAVSSRLHLAKFYLAENPDRALALALQAKQQAGELGSDEDRLEVLQFLIKNSRAGAASRYAVEFATLSDSLARAKQLAQNHFAAMRYDYTKEREDRLRSEAKVNRLNFVAEQEKNERLKWTFGTMFTILSSGIVIGFLYWRHKKERLKAAYDAEVRISTKLHDELANEVHKTIVFAETRNLSETSDKEILLQRLETIYEGTRSISRDNSEIPKDIEFSQALRDLLQEYNSDECAVIAQGIANVDWTKMERHKRVEFYRIVQELLANMRKHSGCSHALFLFGSNGKNVSLNYSDNGTGAEKNGQNRKNGLRIMENRISSLKGTLTFEAAPGNGFRAYIQFPL